MDKGTGVKRRPTAILAADAVGYSPRMAENEERAHSTLVGHRRLIDCIASSVFDQISGKLNLGFEDIGERSLKNIGRPVRAYRVGRAGSPPRPQRGSRKVVFAGVAILAVVPIVGAGWYLMSARNRNDATPPLLSQPAQPPATPPGSTAASQPAPSGPANTPPPLRVPSSSPLAVKGPTKSNLATYSAGFAQARCPRGDRGPAVVLRGPLQVLAGEVRIELGEPGQPGYITLRGRPDSEGTLILEGFVIPGAGRARGTKVPARYEGRLVNGRGTLTGNQGIQRCTVGLELK